MQEDKKIEEYISGLDFESKEKPSLQEKIEHFVNGKFFVPIVVILVAIIAFVLGEISGLQEKKEPVRILSSNNSPPNPSLMLREGSSEPSVLGEVKGVTATSSGQVVASKSGTKYHYPWCAGAKQISEKNKIIFNTIEEARIKGYTPASNCKGLK